MGSDRIWVHRASPGRCFYPRSRTGSDGHPPAIFQHLIGFYPRSRTGSDLTGLSSMVVSRVSIHAPARGATNFTARKSGHLLVSIHAPARGATPSAALCTARVGGFYPRSRTGSDRQAAINAAVSAGFLSTLPHGERQLSLPLNAHRH